MHLQEFVDVLHGGAGPLGDADLALGVEQFRANALLRSHRADDRIHADQHFVVGGARGHRLLDLLYARQHRGKAGEPAHARHLSQLVAQVVHVEQTLGHTRGHRLGFFDLDRFGGAFDEADDVAHAEDAARDAAWLEQLDPVELFACADEFYRLAGDRAHRQCRAAAGIAVHPREHDAGQRYLLGEALGDVDRVLASQRVDDEQDFVGIGDRGDGLHLLHQRLIDMEATRGVEQQHIIALELRGLERAPRDVDRLLALNDRQGRDRGLRAEYRKLLLCGRTIDVERRHHDLLAVLLGQPFGELGGGRRLA